MPSRLCWGPSLKQLRLQSKTLNGPSVIKFIKGSRIDAVNQGNASLSIKLRLECFVIVE